MDLLIALEVSRHIFNWATLLTLPSRSRWVASSMDSLFTIFPFGSLFPAESQEHKFQYKEGSVYSYIYTVNGTTSVLGGPPTQSGLHLAATVSLRFLTACDAFLFVSSFQSNFHCQSVHEDDWTPVNPTQPLSMSPAFP